MNQWNKYKIWISDNNQSRSSNDESEWHKYERPLAEDPGRFYDDAVQINQYQDSSGNNLRLPPPNRQRRTQNSSSDPPNNQLSNNNNNQHDQNPQPQTDVVEPPYTYRNERDAVNEHSERRGDRPIALTRVPTIRASGRDARPRQSNNSTF